jgi:3-phosphoshikimate 1-carboxyvinyltransferase
VVRVRRSTLEAGAFTVPGDPSQAAFWVVGGVVVPGSLVTVDGIQLGIERLGYLGVLRRMGATIEIEESGDGTGSLTSYTCALHGTVVEADEIPSLDEVPVLAVAAAVAHGPTRFRGVGELRVKESDRLSGTVELIRAFGGEAEADGDDLVVQGPGAPLEPGRVDSRGDHRMAMAAAIAGAACLPGAETTITGWESVATSYPGFADDLERLRSPAGDRG